MKTVFTSDSTSDEFIHDVLRIDNDVYSKNNCGTFESVCGRFNANKESYILLYDNHNLIGYACYFPIDKVLSNKITNGNNFLDDNITPVCICKYDREFTMDVFLISIAIEPSYQGCGYGKKLLADMFKQLETKIHSGYKIGKIYAEAVSDKGAELLFSNEFKLIKQLNDGTRVLAYEFDDFSSCNVYSFAPAKITNGLLYESCGSYDNNFVSDMNTTAYNEFSNEICNLLKRRFLTATTIILKSDDGAENIGSVKANLYATDYKNYCIIVTELHNIGCDPTYYMDAVSTESLVVSVDGKERLFNEYVKTFGLKIVGRSKTFVSLVKRPRETYLNYLLAGEAYASNYLASTISPETTSLVIDNCAQYDFSDIYESEIATVYVMNIKYSDDATKYKYEQLMIFILELLSLQISAIGSNYKTVIDKLNNSQFSGVNVNDINLLFSKSAQLWDVDNFKYLLARQLYEKTSEISCLRKQKKQFFDALSIYEKLSAMHSQSKIETTTKITGKYFLVFSILSGFSTINSVISLIFQLVSHSAVALQAGITIITGLLGLLFLIVALVLYKISQKKRNNLHKTKKKD